jgi:hypothetical protein
MSIGDFTRCIFCLYLLSWRSPCLSQAFKFPMEELEGDPFALASRKQPINKIRVGSNRWDTSILQNTILGFPPCGMADPGANIRAIICNLVFCACEIERDCATFLDIWLASYCSLNQYPTISTRRSSTAIQQQERNGRPCAGQTVNQTS